MNFFGQNIYFYEEFKKDIEHVFNNYFLAYFRLFVLLNVKYLK